MRYRQGANVQSSSGLDVGKNGKVERSANSKRREGQNIPGVARRPRGNDGQQYDYFRDTNMGLPDIIDIRLLMNSKEELLLPQEQIFTQSDLRSLIIIPYSRRY